MILKVGMKFIRGGVEYEITGKGQNDNYLKLLGDRCLITEMHIDTFNMLYERGDIEILFKT
jgi:hypothetical protein